MNDMNRLVEKTEMIPCNSINMNEQLNRFIEFLEVSSISVRSYRAGIRQFVNYVQVEGISHPTRETVIMYKKALIASGKKSATISLYLSALRRFFAWTESEVLYPNITAGVKSPKQDRGHKRDAFSAKQLQGIIGNMSHDSLQAKRDYALFTLIASCGLRTIEVVRADCGDLREVQGEYCLYIQGKGRNSKTDFVKLCKPVVEAIREYLNARGAVEDSAPLFASCSRRNKGGRLTTRTVSGVCKTAMKAAGYDSSRLTAHSLRHSAVTIALLEGASLQEVSQFARHSSINVTMCYAHDVERLSSQVESKIAGALFAA